jgi:hypothetical protein
MCGRTVTSARNPAKTAGFLIALTIVASIATAAMWGLAQIT